MSGILRIEHLQHLPSRVGLLKEKSIQTSVVRHLFNTKAFLSN